MLENISNTRTKPSLPEGFDEHVKGTVLGKRYKEDAERYVIHEGRVRDLPTLTLFVLHYAGWAMMQKIKKKIGAAAGH